ncbi:anaphase-promoting complex, cyclosome, subunit 4-domain-containing protein [Dissophora ornata]|nr:anaphase-promoting complex, cyclosome, subunit 4-domain-containing protein [Dissophora ornata]
MPISMATADSESSHVSLEFNSLATSFSPTFELYAEKQFPPSIKLEAWCPTADLLALVNHQNDLELYRLSWQRHWSIPIRVDATLPGDTTGNTKLGQSIGGFGGFGGFQQPPRPRVGINTSGTVKADAVSMTWRPDGKMIAVGLSNGQVNVYDYRDGALVYTMGKSDRLHPTQEHSLAMSSVRCLKWADIYLGRPTEATIFGTHQRPKSILEALPLLSPIPLSSTQQQMMMARSMFNKNSTQGGGSGLGGANNGSRPEEGIDDLNEESSDIMNVLLSGDNQGLFKLRMFGGFETNPLSLMDLLDSYGVKNLKTLSIMKMDIQLHLSELVIIALGSRHNGRAIGDLEACLFQITLSSELLEKHSREVRTLGLKKRPVIQLLKYLADGIQVMQTEYTKISQMVANCIESVQSALNDNGETTTPTYEFIQLLMTGHRSTSMDQYLQQELRRHGLRRWDRSTKAAYSSIQRVAFECLLPACERLLIHLSDILGCSRWHERYKSLRLEEAPVYNCIKIVGDFIGMIERLFSVLKVELKQFHEFENWLEQVLEALQPTVRAPDDQGDDDSPKKFPPVDILCVSEYLKSGLANKGLQSFFKQLENSGVESEDPPTSKPHSTAPDREEDIALSYTSTPSYPILYSFSDELQNLVREAEVKATANAATDASQRLQLSRKETSSTDSNPFAGSAIAAALAGRGFGLLPSKKLGSSSIFSKAVSPSPQPAISESTPSGDAAMARPHQTTAKTTKMLTLEKHLELMTRHCQSIFKGPSEAVAKSMKVVHALDLIAPEVQERDLDSANENDGSRQISKDVIERLSKRLKLATRYCYQDLTPWHYLSIYLDPCSTLAEPSLCILRCRRRIRRHPSVEDNPSSDNNIRKRIPSTHLHSRTLGDEPFATEITATKTTRIGQKRRASDAEPIALTMPFSKARVKSPTPTVENLTLYSPRSEPTLAFDDTELVGDGKVSTNELREGQHEHELWSEPGPGDLEFEVAFFSLQEHGEANDEGNTIARGLTDDCESHGGIKKPLYEIRDVVFLDDDALGVILNTCGSAPGGLADVHQEQFLLSVAIHSPGRPYQPVPSSEIVSPDTSPFLDHTTPSCLLDRLSSLLVSRRSGNKDSGKGHTPSALFTTYTLPVSRFSRITSFTDSSPLETTAESQVNDNQVSPEPRSTVSASMLETSQQKTSTDQGLELVGPCRIASNERDKRRVVSVHGPSHEGASILQGAGKITVFELEM